MTKPVVNVFFDFNSPYSLLTILRLYLRLQNTSYKAEYSTSSADYSHPALSKVSFVLKPIEYGLVLKKSGIKGTPIAAGSKRRDYMWLDVSRALKRMGQPQIDDSKLSNWPQKASTPNRIVYLLQDKTLLFKSAAEVLTAEEASSLKSAYSTCDSDLISVTFAYKIFYGLFVENSVVSDDGYLVQQLSDTLKTHVSNPEQLASVIVGIASKSQILKKESFIGTEEAMTKGFFGVPTFTFDNCPLFYWGNDHMTDAAIEALESKLDSKL
ncbi:hypothetical protein BB560_002490 [Smittium megazygosporum]|uniref:DSBA-like thioredoxin domain-containing protein n=1 Tax=Smittium megazygosporum TaxID=133381 RepID=A0A2T9ZEL3_9FUNG|nr:hypothetical protein BB560_002490 [Smittium megazygosporum]